MSALALPSANGNADPLGRLRSSPRDDASLFNLFANLAREARPQSENGHDLPCQCLLSSTYPGGDTQTGGLGGLGRTPGISWRQKRVRQDRHWRSRPLVMCHK